MKFPSFDLTGKVALVTGGSRGLGRGIALGLANAGADVAICGRNEETARATAAEISELRSQKPNRKRTELGGTSLAISADVSVVSDIDSMVEQVMEKFKRIDILVNSAGINYRMPAIEMTEEYWDAIIDVNLKGTFFCCQAVGKVMIQQNQGKIINIGSLNSTIALPTVGPYGATKGGVHILTKALAIEWAPYNINVNCIGPGFYNTDLARPLFETPGWQERLLEMIPMNRPGVPEDLMGIAVFLASDASNYITGQTIFVDGGFLAGWKRFV